MSNEGAWWEVDLGTLHKVHLIDVWEGKEAGPRGSYPPLLALQAREREGGRGRARERERDRESAREGETSAPCCAGESERASERARETENGKKPAPSGLILRSLLCRRERESESPRFVTSAYCIAGTFQHSLHGPLWREREIERERKREFLGLFS